MKTTDFQVIFDNGGGISVQTQEEYYFFGDDHETAADSVAGLLDEETTEFWEGNQPESRIEYSSEEVRNGRYRWLHADEIRTAIAIGKDYADHGWYNVTHFFQILKKRGTDNEDD